MGKLTDSAATASRTTTTTTQSMVVVAKVPTSEQIRMAQLLADPKSDDHSSLKEKVHKVIELTRCDENSALIALHDCNNDVEEAVDKLLEGGQVEDEWIVQEGKKAKKLNQVSTTEDGMGNAGNDYDGIGGKMSAGGRRPRGGTGSWGAASRSTADGPPRLRGRSRGTFNKENDARGDFDSGEGGGFGRGRGRGGIGRDGAERGGRGRGRGGFGGGRGGRRGGGFNQNGGGGGGLPQIDSWSSPQAENNTWDNSMASTLNSEAGGEWGKRAAARDKKTWENSSGQANDYDWGGEEDVSKLREGLIIEPSYAQKSAEKTAAALPGACDTTSSSVQQPAALNHVARPSAEVQRVRGESVDVNSLFTSNQPAPVHCSPLPSTDAWTTSKQATADIKSELGIGKAIPSAVGDSIRAPHRAADSITPSKLQAAKVELPLGRAPTSVGPIDVQFGDMTLSSETSQPLCDMNISSGYQTQPSVAASQHKDRNTVLRESPHQQAPGGGVVFHRSVAGGDHVNGPDRSGSAAQNTDKTEQQHSSFSNAAPFVTSQADQQTMQQQQQHKSSVHLQQQQQPFHGGHISHSAVNQMPPKSGSTGIGGGVGGDYQRSHLMPSSNAGPNSSQQQQTHVIDSVASQQSSRDELGHTNALSGQQSMQAVSKNQMANQPITPYQQAMANVVPYLGMTYDQSLNSMGYLQAQSLLLNASGGLDMRAVNTLSGANITVGRDANDMKTHMPRQDNGASMAAAAAGNLNVPPPGLPAPTVSNAEHAAQLLNFGLLQQLQFLNPAGSPYMQPQFYVPNVSSANAVTTGNQYQRVGGYQTVPALFGYEDIQQMQPQQDYGKSPFSVMPPPSAQGKQLAGGAGPQSGMSLGGNDVGNKYGGGMKMPYESNKFANTATPPPLGNMNFSPAATGPAQYGYTNYLPPMNMMTAPAVQSNPQLPNDLLSQRGGGNQNGKPPGGSNTVGKSIGQQYQYGGQWGNN